MARTTLTVVLIAIGCALSFSLGLTWSEESTSPIPVAERILDETIGDPDESQQALADDRWMVTGDNGQAAPAALPPEGINLASVYSELANRARRGDGSASLRLYRDLSLCRDSSMQPDPDELMIAMRDLKSQDSQHRVANVYLSLERRRCHDAKICAGLTQQQLADPVSWLVMAANSGDLDARVAVASGDFLFGGYLDSFQYAALFKAKAQQWLEEGVAAGHLRAFEISAQALAIRDPGVQAFHLAQLLVHDPIRAYERLYAVSKVPGLNPENDKWLSRVAPLLKPDTLLAAEIRGNRIYQQLLRKYPDVAMEHARFTAKTATLVLSDEDIMQRAPQCIR